MEYISTKRVVELQYHDAIYIDPSLKELHLEEKCDVGIYYTIP